ncbi:tripartite tricarboxylate transporter substrate binding protein [Ramlibacter rhizophilus]|uniref:Tripartite tricarboxylate transporter substrate binding protein n=1 Tax=Ramlibacter rhizophilus TaxID=1781167 RepID=A0A4Z0BYT4_9BURK|nr:tripartite tricarboxylate transporter substrate binding protein [Ramlibacter rhizophilus]TFZ04497.1 tripartite tricarboxylate transporter substrate binding protein [Ramlibacter rhizophilus]
MNPSRPATLSRRTFVGAAAAIAAPFSFGQTGWPDRPVQLVHGFGAGGNADVIARLVAQQLHASLKQPVVVDIKSGAGGMIASSFVAKAPPDGHTLVLLTGGHTASAAMRRTLPYDPVKDFAFISTLTSFPFVVAVRPDHPAKSLADLIQMARSGTKKVSFSSVGVGSTQHLAGELLGGTAGIELLHVPYRGGGAPVQAVVAGDVDVLVDTPTVALPHVQSGTLRALAVTSAAAWPSLPNVPPVAATLPDFEVRSWLGLGAPAGTPEAIVRRLNADVQALLKKPEVRAALLRAGSEPTYSSSEAMREMVQNDIARWRSVIARRGIEIQN